MGLISGLMAYAVTSGEAPNMITVRNHLVGEDPIHRIAVAADKMAELKRQDSMI